MTTTLLDQLQAAFPATYTLEREVGRGGMATVFLARDVRHGRAVAVKVLDPELGAVLGVERFLSEIRVTATLQHPNLLPLFDSGEASGLLYYVMPFVEGETLRARLQREKQLAVGEVVRLGSAIASALDYAHRNGVIHRDLKPENILLQDGQPLVADFGIALAVSNAGGTRVTQTGLSLGTPQYMSPEQATGDRAVDARSDVYALGAILYECLTGEPPHTGATAQAIISRLMTEEPRPIGSTRRSVPAHVEAAIYTALQKLPADRWTSARELAEALQEPSRTTMITAPQRSATRSRMLVAASLLAGIAGTGAAAWSAVSGPAGVSEDPSVHFTVNLPDGVRPAVPTGGNIALSPDGQTLVFTAQSDSAMEPMIFLRYLGSLNVAPITGTELGAHPAFSADGRSIVFKQERQFQRAVFGSGAPLPFSPYTGGWSGGAWHYGNAFYFTVSNLLYQVPADGRSARVVAVAPVGTTLSNPYVLPDGRTIMMRAVRRSTSVLALASSDSGSIEERELEMANVIGYANGRLVFGRLDGSINSVPFELATREFTGAVTQHETGVSVKSNGGVNAALAANGTLALFRGVGEQGLVIRDRTGQAHPVVSRRIDFITPVWSPDGERVAVLAFAKQPGVSASGDVWMYTARTKALTRLTENGALQPSWSADGRHLAYVDRQDGGVWLLAVNGSERPRKLLGRGYREPQLSADGRYVVAERTTQGPSTRSQIVRVLLEDTTKVEVLADDQVDNRFPRISPDGNWLAYVAQRGAGQELYVTSARSGAGRVSISSVSPRALRWDASSRAFYYVEGSVLLRARLSYTGAGGNVDGIDTVMVVPARNGLDVSTDGERLAYVENLADDIRVEVITNWVRALRSAQSTPP
jgi:eukaryotic-like serine/threonine-protein kinase